jgi:hypothetical protein
LFDAPTTFWLRSLPRARTGIVVAIALGLAAAEAPWVALHARGGGPVAGAAAVTCAAALHAFVVGPRWLVAAGVAAAVVLGGPAWAQLAVGAAGCAVAIPSALRAAPERAARRRYARLELAAAAPVLVIAAGGLVDAFVAAERETGWLLDACAAGPELRAGALAGAAALAGAGAGAVFAGLTAAPRAIPDGAVVAVALALLRRRARDGSRAMIAAGVVGFAGALLGWYL